MQNRDCKSTPDIQCVTDYGSICEKKKFPSAFVCVFTFCMITYLRWCRQYPSIKKTEVHFEKISCLYGKSGYYRRFVFCPFRRIERNIFRSRAISYIRNSRSAADYLPRSDPRTYDRLFFHKLLFLALRCVRYGARYACNAHRRGGNVSFAPPPTACNPSANHRKHAARAADIRAERRLVDILYIYV